MAGMPTGDRLEIRVAEMSEVPAIVRLLADDALGARREQAAETVSKSYLDAFDEIERDPNNELIVAVQDGDVIACFQMTYIPGLSYQGGERAQIESVRVAAGLRGQGIGRRVMEWAIERARTRGCRLVQLSTNKERADAHRFYESLGFERSHEGMKLIFDKDR